MMAIGSLTRSAWGAYRKCVAGRVQTEQVGSDGWHPNPTRSSYEIIKCQLDSPKPRDPSTPPAFLRLPSITPLPVATAIRSLALIEEMSMHFPDAPAEALLGTVESGVWTKRMWMEPVTENPAPGATEVWEMYNTTGDAHPMHVHDVVFEVVNRQEILIDEAAGTLQLAPGSAPIPPEPWERGLKDTVCAYQVRSPESGHGSTSPASSSGTATSLSTRITR